VQACFPFSFNDWSLMTLWAVIRNDPSVSLSTSSEWSIQIKVTRAITWPFQSVRRTWAFRPTVIEAASLPVPALASALTYFDAYRQVAAAPPT